MNWTPDDLAALSPDLYDELIAWIVEQQPKREE